MGQWGIATVLLIAAALLIIAALVGAKVLDFISDFSGELRYLNNEIRRTVGEERMGWIRKRRRLWLSLIPFVRY